MMLKLCVFKQLRFQTYYNITSKIWSDINKPGMCVEINQKISLFLKSAYLYTMNLQKINIL